MSRNKPRLMMLLLLAVLLCCTQALGESLISEDMIKKETVNYSNTFTVELGTFERSYSEQASEYYPHTYVLRFEGDNARFGEYLVGRKQEVKAGDVLATFTLDVDEVALASKRQALMRAEESYALQKQDRQEAIQDQLEALEKERNAFAYEIQTLKIQRAQVALEQFCSQQERHIENMRQEIAELEEKYSQTTIVAPYDGVITSLTYKQEGERLYPNEELITLYRTDGMMLRITNNNGHFRYGMQVTVAAGPAKSRTYFTGRIIAADTTLAESKRAGYAYIELDPGQEEFPTRGIQPTVSAATYYVDQVYCLPRRAVEAENGKYYVYKLVDGKVEKRFVNVALQGITEMWVLQGVEVGETIIID